MIRKKLDFFRRPEEERDMLIAEVWCHRCQDVDLGLDDPQEFEGNGMVFLEGKCMQCGTTVVAEIIEEHV